MKKSLLFILCVLCLFAVSCSKTETTNTEDSWVPETLEEKFFYCFGYYMADSYSQYYTDMDYNAVSQGVKAAGKGSMMFTDAEFQQIFADYEAQLNADVAQENLKEAENFLAENKKKEGVKETASGLQYLVIKEGSGKKPDLNSRVTLDYELSDINGNVLESTLKSGQKATFALTQVIRGFQEGVLLMSEGSTYRLFLHPDIAYGKNGTGNIQPNQALIFEITLHSVN